MMSTINHDTGVPCNASQASESALKESTAAYDRPLIPNATTIAAIEEARKGGLPRFASVQALMEALNADD